MSANMPMDQKPTRGVKRRNPLNDENEEDKNVKAPANNNRQQRQHREILRQVADADQQRSGRDPNALTREARRFDQQDESADSNVGGVEIQQIPPAALRKLNIDMVATTFTVSHNAKCRRRNTAASPTAAVTPAAALTARVPRENDEREEEKVEEKMSSTDNSKRNQKSDSNNWLKRKDVSGRWDRTADSLRRMRVEVAEEDIFGDYYEKHRRIAAVLIKKECEDNRETYKAKGNRKKFWNKERALEIRSDPSHSSLEVAKNWSKPKWREQMTNADVKNLLRFIRVGALCERCENPFELEGKELDTAAPSCTCPAPTASRFVVDPKGIRVPRKSTHKEEMEKEWTRQCAIEEKRAREGLRDKLIAELGTEEKFNVVYPKYKVSLARRKDPFGEAVREKQKELHDLRRAHNQPPTFIFAWTDKEEGDVYLPKTWILDGELEMSEGALKKIEGKSSGTGHLKCNCRTKCGKCCSSREPWYVNEKGILRMRNGLGPSGTGDSILQPHECVDVQTAVCGNECGCDEMCHNRFSERGGKIKILFQRPSIGWSVRTAEPIVRGEYLLSFSGVVSTDKEMKANGETMEMVMGVGSLKLTIATDARSNEFRCINHSCGPNGLVCATYAKRWGQYVHGIALFARRGIEAYEELTFDYYSKGGEKFRFDCQCGSYACRGIRNEGATDF